MFIEARQVKGQMAKVKGEVVGEGPAYFAFAF